MSDTLPSTGVATGDSLVNRMIRAARLDVSLYEEVEADRTATSQAAIAVVIVAVASAIGGAISAMMSNSGAGVIGAVISGIVGALLQWVIFSYLAYFIGTRLFNGTATPGELLRTIGFAASPGVLNILSFVPILGFFISLAAGIWWLVAAVIAIRQALDIDTVKAVVTGIISWAIPFVIFGVLIGTLMAILFGIIGMSGAGTP